MLRTVGSARDGRSLDVNMTSMVDIVFLLIIFFMLVSSFMSAENVEIDLPRPDASVAEVLELQDRVVLNCRFLPGGGDQGTDVVFQLGVRRVQTLEDLEGHLRAIAQERPGTQVILRADRRSRYALIRGALQAVARAGIQDVHIAAEVEE